MIAGIGVDIVEIRRIDESLSRLGDRFAQRILSDEEFAQFQTHNFPVKFLAKRFAAKEAAVKALGTGFSHGISLQHISVSNDALGKPELTFHHIARELMTRKDIKAAHLSLADEEHYAIAYVILEN